MNNIILNISISGFLLGGVTVLLIVVGEHFIKVGIQQLKKKKAE